MEALKTKTLAESSELLRISLPMMAKYNVPVTPDNYAVWYEYVAGENPLLKTRMDELIQKGSAFGSGLTQALYREFIDPSSNIERAEKTQHSLSSIADSITKTITTATGEADRYEKSLEMYEERINDGMKVEQIQSMVSELSDLTKNMHKGNDALLNDLIEARMEADKLRKELKIAQAEATTDPLTELANRKAFFNCIRDMKESGKASEKGHCILIADIDNFKNVNDTYGHIFGDKVIKIVASILKKMTKGRDLAVRFGGEEFLILLTDTNLAGAQTVAEDIRRTMEEGRIIKPKTGEAISKVTISIGLTQFSLVEPFEEAIARADEALYRAKGAGRNRVEVGYLLEEFAAVSH